MRRNAFTDTYNRSSLVFDRSLTATLAIVFGVVLIHFPLQYIETESTTVVVAVISFGGFVILLGIALLARAIRDGRREKRERDAQASYVHEPWRVRTEWRKNPIVSGNRINFTELGVAILFLAVTVGLGFFLLSSPFLQGQTTWIILGVSLFVLLGLYGLGKALVNQLRNHKFGRTTVLLEPFPGTLGQTLDGSIQTHAWHADVPQRGFQVELSCFEQRLRISDEYAHIEKDLIWRGETTSMGHMDASGTRMTVSFTFDVPSNLPPSTPRKTEERDLWELSIKAQMPGVSYRDTIEIPVFPPETSITPRQVSRNMNAR